MPSILTIEELAKVLLVGYRHVGKLVAAKAIPSFSLSPHTRRIREQSFLRALVRFYVGSKYVKPSELPKDWMKPPMVAEMLGCSTATILRMVRMRGIPFYKFGGHTIRFRASDIEAWIVAKEKERNHARPQQDD